MEDLGNVLVQILGWGDNILLFFIVLGIFFEITPIKINPISSIVNFFHKPVKKDMEQLEEKLDAKIDNVEKNIKIEIVKLNNDQAEINSNITELIRTNEMQDISRIRWDILEFANSIDNDQLHTRDEYRHIKEDFELYHSLIDKYGLKNGVLDEEMEKINKHYAENCNSNQVYF